MTPPPDRVAAIRERLAKAPKSPWTWEDFYSLKSAEEYLGIYQEAAGGKTEVYAAMEVIEHAPTDLAYLLDALAQAKKECALLKMQVDAMAGELPRAVQENLERAVVAEKHLAQVTAERDRLAQTVLDSTTDRVRLTDELTLLTEALARCEKERDANIR